MNKEDVLKDFCSVRSVITLGAFLSVYAMSWLKIPIPDVLIRIVDLLLGYWFGSKTASAVVKNAMKSDAAKQVAAALIVCFIFAAPAMAQESGLAEKLKSAVDKIDLSSGLVYDLQEKEVLTPLTFCVMEYSKAANPDSKWQVALAKFTPKLLVGYVPKDKFVAGGSFTLTKASDFGITIPVLDLIKIEPMVLYGWGDVDLFDLSNADDSVMIGSRIIEWKF